MTTAGPISETRVRLLNREPCQWARHVAYGRDRAEAVARVMRVRDRARQLLKELADQARIRASLEQQKAGAIDLAIIALVAAQPELRPAADQRDDAESAVAVAADHLIAAALALAAAVATYRVALRDRRDDELPFCPPRPHRLRRHLSR